MVCPPATSEAEARWLRFGLVVVATYAVVVVVVVIVIVVVVLC
jgi:hypothetical protein